MRRGVTGVLDDSLRTCVEQFLEQTKDFAHGTGGDHSWADFNGSVDEVYDAVRLRIRSLFGHEESKYQRGIRCQQSGTDKTCNSF